MKRIFKMELKILTILCSVVFMLAISSMYTAALVQMTQIIGYLLIILMIPIFITTKSVEAKSNILLNAAKIAEIRDGKKEVQSTPTEVVDSKTDTNTVEEE